MFSSNLPIMILSSLLSLVTIGWAAPIPIQFEIDPDQSSLTWSANFKLGDLSIPLQPVSPGSLTSTIEGGFQGTLDPTTHELALSVGPSGLFQPDSQNYLPSASLGELSSVGGKIEVAGLINGFLSVRDAEYYIVPFSVAGFEVDALPIHDSWTPLPTSQIAAGLVATFDYSLSGLTSAMGSLPVDLSPLRRPVDTSYRRTGDSTFEIKFEIDRPVLVQETVTIGAITLMADIKVQGTIVAKANVVPEVPSSLLCAGVLLVVAFPRLFLLGKR